jgi:ribosomal protein L11 methyltransferase
LLRLTGIASRHEEAISSLAFEYDALGVSEALEFSQPEGEEDVFTRTSDVRTLNVYFQEAPSDLFVQKLKAQFPEVQVEVSKEQNKDWLEEWKKGFKPFPLTRHHWVVPSWCKPPAEVKHRILIDPGMAFGTGTHETTQLCAEAIEQSLREREVESLLDVGTGTGILAILAHQLWVPTVAATELEPDARRVARENFVRNEAEDIELPDIQVEDLIEEYDIVVANIIDGVLVRIQEALKKRVKKGGLLILSGIIAEREQDFLKGFKLPPSTKWKKRTQKGDWLCYEVEL